MMILIKTLMVATPYTIATILARISQLDRAFFLFRNTPMIAVNVQIKIVATINHKIHANMTIVNVLLAYQGAFVYVIGPSAINIRFPSTSSSKMILLKFPNPSGVLSDRALSNIQGYTSTNLFVSPAFL